MIHLPHHKNGTQTTQIILLEEYTVVFLWCPLARHHGDASCIFLRGLKFTTMAMALPMLRPGFFRGVAAPKAFQTLSRLGLLKRPSQAATPGLHSCAQSEINEK